MKYSRIAMLAWLGILLLTLILVVGIARSSVEKVIDEAGQDRPRLSSVDRDDWISWEENPIGMQGLQLEGAWVVQISKGDISNILITAPGEEYVTYSESSGMVTLRNEWRSRRDKNAYLLDITLPSLSMLVIDGAAEVAMENIETGSLIITNNGAGDLDAENCYFSYLQVENNGAMDMNLLESSVHDAVIAINGAGDIRLNMDGGMLDVTINGMGGVKYSGEVSDERTRINGLGKVSELDN